MHAPAGGVGFQAAADQVLAGTFDLAAADVMTRGSTDAITLRTATLAEIQIHRAEIDELKESPASIMPQGLETRLSETELRDLLVYLMSADHWGYDRSTTRERTGG